MGFVVRPSADLGEFDSAFMQIGQYFGSESDPDRAERFSRLLPVDRMHAAFEGERIVGGAGAFPFPMSVPGGLVDCAGTTVIGVAPTHRRRGVLRSMMREHLDDAHERGEPIAALWASEETIYGRYGYGRAGFAGEVTIPRDRVGFGVPFERRGTMRFVDADEALVLFPPLWESLGRERPGVFSRSRDWWELRTLRDPPDSRHGGGPKRLVALELDGRTAAYAVYRHHMSWDGGASDGKIAVVEAIGDGAQSTAELWRFLLDIDWVARIEAHLLPPDHPLFFLLAEPRRMRYRMGDSLWVRLLDVGAALSARAYAVEDELVFDVRDEFCPWNEGRWRLAGGSAGRTDGGPDIRLDIRELGSAYLGGIGFVELAQAGRVEAVTPGALARADSVFRAALHPWCPEIF
ncbi:MAG: GNAT family N-acetyltransferase [Gaiellaceae bacterium]